MERMTCEIAKLLNKKIPKSGIFLFKTNQTTFDLPGIA